MNAQGNNGSLHPMAAPAYKVAWTPKGRGRGSAHFTTDGITTLCNRPVDLFEGREPMDAEPLCGLCRKSRAKGSVSSRWPRGSSRPRSQSTPAPTRSPLEEKVFELERLATEIRELEETRKAKIARVQELKGEITRFLASVKVET